MLWIVETTMFLLVMGENFVHRSIPGLPGRAAVVSEEEVSPGQRAVVHRVPGGMSPARPQGEPVTSRPLRRRAGSPRHQGDGRGVTGPHRS